MKRCIILLIMAMVVLLTYLPIIAQDVGAAEEPFDAAASTVPQTQASDAKENENSGIVKVQGIECPLVLTDSISQSNSGAGAEAQSEKSLRDVIFETQMSFAESVNVYAYKLTLQQLKDVVQDLVYSEPMLFHLQNTYSYSIMDGYIYAYSPHYWMTKEEYTDACVYVDQELDSILTLSGATEVEDDFLQALLINDYLASHYKYDTTYSYYDMYNMLTHKTAVCQGYTLLYDELLTRCGIEVGYAQSDAMKHIWNLVKIGEHYYHVDVTWSDPIPDNYSWASHEYFMLSDAYVASDGPRNPHHSWVSHNGIVCDDDTYDATTILTQSESPFVLCEGEIYYIESETGNISKYIDAFTVGTTVYTIDGIWYVADKPGYYYPGTFSGLASFEGKLYFNTADQVGAYDVKEGTVEWIATAQDNAGDIVGVRYIGERTVEYGLAADAASKQLTALYTYLIPKAQLLMGDLNEDDVVDMKDAAVLQRHVLKINEITDESVLAAADVTGDGIVDMKDAAKLTRFVIKVIDSLE